MKAYAYWPQKSVISKEFLKGYYPRGQQEETVPWTQAFCWYEIIFIAVSWGPRLYLSFFPET